MKTAPRHPHAALIRQAVLIVLPIGVLSSVALYSLQRDRALIELDAKERARAVAPETASRWSRRVSESITRLVSVDPANLPLEDVLQPQCLMINGEVRSPVDFASPPKPADWPGELKPEQSRLWEAAEAAFFQARDLGAARKAVSRLSGRVPEAIQANAELNLLLLESKERAAPDLAARFVSLARRNRTVSTPSGVSLADLSLIQALRCSSSSHLPAGFWDEFQKRISEHPSFLTPELMEEAERAGRDPEASHKLESAKRLWLARKRSVSLLHELRRRSIDSSRSAEVWLDLEGTSFLALCSPYGGPEGTKGAEKSETGVAVTLVPARLVGEAFQAALDESKRDLPSYAGFVARIGDRQWTGAGGFRASNPRSARAEVLASAGVALEVRLSGFSSDHPFEIGVELVAPEVLYSSYRQRLILAGGLVLSAVVAALIGLTSAWRSFQRQLRLSEMKSGFVSSVSHELRAPLASVRLMAESLERGTVADDIKRREYYRMIVRECGRLSSLVENVLDFSRISQGRKQYEFEPIDLDALVGQTVKSMEPYAHEKGVGISFSGPPSGLEEIQPRWDGQAVAGALVNLIDNAIKHAPPESVVAVALEQFDDPSARNGSSRTIQLSVEDQGHGFPEEEKERIFEPFYRYGSELRRETRGAGIGLSIVKHVAEAHGGSVLVESVVGKGSRFTLVLPLVAGNPKSGRTE
jgi:signal transduction histidine kinase